MYNRAVELYNPVMGILLLAVLLGSVACFLLALVLFSDGDRIAAWRIVKAWGIVAGVYGAVLLITAMAPRTSRMKTGTPYCDDDLCMSVLNVNKTPQHDSTLYRMAIRLSSRANHGPRSAKGALVYLTDERHREFFPVDASPVSFDATVDPGQSVDTSLTFELPPDAGRPNFEVRVDRIGYTSFIIGSRELLRKPMLTLAIE
jgi:hypothetical protein